MIKEIYSKHFATKTRNDGKEFTYLKTDAPEEVRDVLYAAHEDKLPDDYVYLWASEAFSELEMLEDEEEVQAAIDEVIGDIYTSELTAWLNSRNDRVFYLTEALEEYEMKDGFQALSFAQEIEKKEVYNTVGAFIINKLEEGE